MTKPLAVLALLVISFSQVGFVLAEDKTGTICYNNSDCNPPGGACCCCNADAASGACTTPKEGLCGNAKCTNVICPFSTHGNLSDLISSLVSRIFTIGIIVAPLMIVVGAAVFMTSGGNPNRSTLGKNIIKWAAIGLGIILFAKGVQGIIQQIVTG